jgi:glutathione peroxidase
MTYRQKILRAVYPVWMWLAKLTGKNNKNIDNPKGKRPPVSFYYFKAVAKNGSQIDF